MERSLNLSKDEVTKSSNRRVTKKDQYNDKNPYIYCSSEHVPKHTFLRYITKSFIKHVRLPILIAVWSPPAFSLPLQPAPLFVVGKQWGQVLATLQRIPELRQRTLKNLTKTIAKLLLFQKVLLSLKQRLLKTIYIKMIGRKCWYFYLIVFFFQF